MVTLQLDKIKTVNVKSRLIKTFKDIIRLQARRPGLVVLRGRLMLRKDKNKENIEAGNSPMLKGLRKYTLRERERERERGTERILNEWTKKQRDRNGQR